MFMHHPACARLPLLWIHARLDQLTESLVSCAVDTMIQHDDQIDRTTFRELNAEYLERMADVLALGAQLARAASVARRRGGQCPGSDPLCSDADGAYSVR